MEMYETEEQQVAAIKDWWKKNAKSVIGGAVIGFGLIFGWKAYNEHMQSQKEQVSFAYEQALSAIEQDDTAYEALQNFIDTHAQSQYAALASLKLAALYSKAEQYEKAEAQLSWVIDKASQEIVTVAAFRLARIQIQLKKYDAALASLNTISSEAFAAKVMETKGDIYVAQGKETEAREAYQNSVNKGGISTSRSLQMKLDDLAEKAVSLDSLPEIDE